MFWERFGRGTAPLRVNRLQSVSLTLPGWSEDASSIDFRVWHDSAGDVLSLSIFDTFRHLPEVSDEIAIQHWSRSFAEAQGAGLIEASVTSGSIGLIYKRLQRPTYVFTGMVLMPRQEACLVWTIVATERGTTGLREAVITCELMSAGKLTIQDYERSFAQDPYDVSYRGVERSNLRFISDDRCYDEQFPEHPLSKVRRILATLPASVHLRSDWEAREQTGGGVRN